MKKRKVTDRMQGSEMKIEVEIELLEELVAIELPRTLANLEDDYEKRKAGTGMCIFHKDKKKDLAELKKHIEAFKLVALYYGSKL